MTALALSFLTFVSTALGGLLALKFRDRLHHLLGFTAGVMLGVVAFDLLPEVFELSGAQGENGLKAMVALVAGFLLFHALEKFVLVHTAHEESTPTTPIPMSAWSPPWPDQPQLSGRCRHRPGLPGVRCRGHHRGAGRHRARLLRRSEHRGPDAAAPEQDLALGADAAAGRPGPVLGAASTLAFTLPPDLLVLYLGGFAGVLLYIGVADILPQAHSQAGPGTSLRLIGLTALGAAVMYWVVQAAG
jgi:ZIP family zinc transporter